MDPDSGRQSQVPSSICPGHKGIRSRSMTASRAGKCRPAQSLGGNHLLIASVSQKHHSNLSWDSRFSPANKHLGSFISISDVKFRSGASPSPTLSLLPSQRLLYLPSSPHPHLQLSLFVALHSNLRCIGRAPGNRMYLAGRRVLMSAKCREMQPRAANWVINL